MSTAVKDDNKKKAELTLNFYTLNKNENAEYFFKDLIKIMNFIMLKNSKNEVKEIKKSAIK